MSSSSIESLRSMGLPTNLCDLINNMINNGKKTNDNNEEAYQTITEVRDDLEMMIDSPEKYLCELDITRTAFQWEMVDGGCCTPLYGREAELNLLMASYHRNRCEVVVIEGPKGIGKSSLFDKFADSFDDQLATLLELSEVGI